MDRTWLLTTLALVTAFSGCIGDDATAPAATVDDTGPAPSHDAPVQAAAASPGCAPNGGNNYGVMQRLGPHEVYVEGSGAYWYEESNGIRGIQTEEDCPENPDTKYVDIGA